MHKKVWLSRVLAFIAASIVLLQSAPGVLAATLPPPPPLTPLPASEVTALDNYPNWVGTQCGSSGATTAPPVTAGTGAPDGATFPNLDPTSMATSINNFIQQQNPNSALKGLGSTIVASSQNSNVSPFLVTAIAREETSMADPGSYNVKHANNPFSREATASQPNYPGEGPNAGTLWYKWSSVKASVDSTAPENQNVQGGGDFPAYLRAQYASTLASGNLINLFLQYAPPGQNDTTAYTNNVEAWIADMVNGTESGSTAQAATAPAPLSSSSSCCSAPTTTVDFGSGTLPSSVPSPYNSIFTAAANKFNIAPAFLAAIFYGGENGNNFPDPPPPYGHGGPWATSGAGAEGPFQFEPATWQTYQQDGNGDGTKDIQDLADASFGAADYLATLGAKNTTDEGTLRLTAAHYNGGPGDSDSSGSYANDVWAAFQKFSMGGGGAIPATPITPTVGSSGCATTTTTTSGVYQDPFRDVKQNGSLFARRIDEGVDYGGHGNVYAIGNGTVSFAGTGDWFGAYGQSVVYKLSDGPAAGKSVYFGESCIPKVTAGQTVTSSTVICYMDGDNDPWVETGWAMGGSAQDEPCAGPDYTAAGNPDGSKMAYGINFSQLLVSLGDPAGNSNPASVSTNPGTTVGSLNGVCNSSGNASDWPTWN